MENIYLNTEIKLSPEQQEKLHEGINQKVYSTVESMNFDWVVDYCKDNLDESDLYDDLHCYISDDFVDREELNNALERINKLEEILGNICWTLQPYKADESPTDG